MSNSTYSPVENIPTVNTMQAHDRSCNSSIEREKKNTKTRRGYVFYRAKLKAEINYTDVFFSHCFRVCSQRTHCFCALIGCAMKTGGVDLVQ